MVARRQHGFENFARLLLAADAGQRVYAPERADVESRFRLAKIVGRFVAAHVRAVAQVFAEGVHRGDKARVMGVDKPDFDHQQYARVQVTAAKAFCKCLPLFAPGLAQDAFAHHRCMAAPMIGAQVLLQGDSNLAQPVAGSPAHQRRRGVHPCAGPKLPHAGIGLVPGQQRLLAHRLQPLEFGQPGTMQQPVVMKCLRRTEHHVAVHVMLKMLLRLVADAHRPHAAVAFQVVHGGLGQVLLQANAVQRLDVAPPGLHHHIAEPAQVVFQRTYLGQAVQSTYDEKSIAQPAVTVIPVALATGRLRNAGGHGGNDGAGVFEKRKLERDRRAYHGVLPLQRNVQALAPFAPVGNGFLLEQPSGIGDAVGQRLIGAQQKVVLARQHKCMARHQVRQWGIGVQPKCQRFANVADMVAALRDHWFFPAPVEAHVQQHPDARRAGDRPDPAHQGHRPEVARAAEKARRKISDLYGLAGLVEKLGAQHGRVGFVPLL